MTLDRAAAAPAPRRIPASRAWLGALEWTARVDAAPERLLADWIEEQAAAGRDRPALLSDDNTLTYGELVARINRHARWALAQGLGRGTVVALVMAGRPDMLATWIGLTRTGATAALVNPRLVGASLAHALAVARPDHVICEATLAPAVTEALGPDAPPVWSVGGPESSPLDRALAALDGSPLRPDERPAVTTADRALLIYTSGTTGLPKAANVSHHRVLNWATWFAGLLGAGPEDRMYDCLPLYHSVGGVVAPCSMLVAGGSAVIRDGFSARAFWRDIVRFDCTLAQYIGELCRYLLQGEPCPEERGHRLRALCGNGLRGDVWEAFETRFAIPQIVEFYAATEGTFSLYNVEGERGAIGRIPPYLAHRFPAALVRFDPETGLPLRGPDGLCVRCGPGEVGEALGKLGPAGEGGRFEGYTDPAETERKVLRDVLKPGDAWFRTGDLMVIDGKGFYRFADRIGDTFRWKGENVSTQEVATALLAAPGVRDAAVYGVAMPGADGKAGMAAIATAEDFDAGALLAHLAATLPPYARPVVLRLQPRIAITETFKTRKGDLQREGFDRTLVQDPLLVLDPQAGRYVPLDDAAATAIAAGTWRF